MTRLVGIVLACVLGLPVVLAAAFVSPGSDVVALAGGNDDEQVATAPVPLRGAFLAVAREAVLPPALLVAVAEVASGFQPGRDLMGLTPAEWARFGPPGARPTDPTAAVRAAARLLLSAGAVDGGGWDAARALRGYTAVASRADVVLAKATAYGYRYRPDGPPVDPQRYAFPVAGSVWYGPHHHDYPATDIFADIGTPVVACVRAVVLRLSRAEVGKGGITVTLRGEDGWRSYYAHLAGITDGLAPGDVVEPGQLLGWSGNTGNARTTPPHLHFGVSLYGPTAGEISPYPYLQAWPRVNA